MRLLKTTILLLAAALCGCMDQKRENRQASELDWQRHNAEAERITWRTARSTSDADHWVVRVQGGWWWFSAFEQHGPHATATWVPDGPPTEDVPEMPAAPEKGGPR